MLSKLALIGITGKKSGGAFMRLIVENIDRVKTQFPGGIRLIVRKNSNISALKPLLGNFELCFSTNEKDCYDELLRDVDTVINIAGIFLSPQIARSAAKNRVRRMILVHTTGIYSKYKSAGEEYRNIDAFVSQVCRENNILLTICRPTMIYGNIYDENVIKFVKMVDRFFFMPVVNRAKYKLQPVHYEDLATAYYQILINEDVTANKNYILSGGQSIYLRDMLRIIGNNLGKKVRFISCPLAIAYMGAWALYLCTFGKKDYREKVQRLCEERVYSHDEATADFGYAPRNFEQGIVDEVIQYMESKNKK